MLDGVYKGYRQRIYCRLSHGTRVSRGIDVTNRGKVYKISGSSLPVEKKIA